MKITHAIFLLVPTILCFTIAEIVARFFNQKPSVFWTAPMMMQYPEEGFDPSVTLEALHFSAKPDRVVKYMPDEFLWYRLDPQPIIPATGWLLLNLGDSSTWNWPYGPWASGYSAILDKLLPDDVHSINLGVPGYSSLQVLRYLELMVKEHHERILAVTIYAGNNDCVENGTPDQARMDALSRRDLLVETNSWLEQHSGLYRVMRNVLPKTKTQTNRAPRVAPGEYRQNLQSMIQLCKKHNIRVILIEPPVHYSWKPGHLTHIRSLEPDVKNPWVLRELKHAKRLHEQAMFLAQNHNDNFQMLLEESVEHDWIMSRIKRDWRQVLREAAIEEDVSLISLPVPFLEAEYPGWFIDYCHPSARVHSFIAHDIAYRLGYAK